MNAPRFETLTRLGFAARGLLYVLTAYLALVAGRNAGSSDVLRIVAGGGGGRVLLALISLGLLAYGAWRCLEAAQDLEGAGGGAKGAVVRLGHGMSGAVHLVLGLLALGLALGVVGRASGGDGADKATGWLMDLPMGDRLVQMLALGLMLGGLSEAWNAYRLKFLKQLDSRAASEAWVKWIGRLGYIARGVVLILVGVLLWRAGETHSPGQAGGVAEVLSSLSGPSRALVAAGLGLFGAFSIVQAVYRRITNPRLQQGLVRRH